MGADDVAEALTLLAAEGRNPQFDQILWDAERSVLSFRRCGIGDFVNLWLNAEDGHLAERNGGSAADSQVLWGEDL